MWGDYHGTSVMSWICPGILVPAVWADLKRGRIPNWLILAGLVSGWLLQRLAGFPNGIPDVLWGMLLPILLGWVLFRIRAIGAGDLKLLSVIGCFHGSKGVLSCMLISIFLAGVFSFAWLLRRRQLVPAILDFFSYLEELSIQRQLIPYESGRKAGRVVPMAVFIGAGYGIWRILPFLPL